MKSFHSIRFSVLAASLALAIPSIQAADAPQIAVAKMTAIASQSTLNYNRFIVTYRDGTRERSNSGAALQNVNAAVGRAGLDRATRSASGQALASLTLSHQRKLATGSELVRSSRKLSASEANTLMQQIAADPAVAHVEPDVMMHAVRDIAAPAALASKAAVTPQTFTPNDPLYAQYQWHFSNATGGANINNAWDLADGNGVTVAVLDTGITQHPDIDLSLADAGYDFISDAFVSGRDTDDRVAGGWDLGDWTTGDAYAECRNVGDPGDDSSWHGTHVSGTVAELTDNGVGMAGVAHHARVLPVRVLGHCGGYTSDIADAIVWASGGHVDGVPDNQNPAQVINMSLGGGGSCTASSVTGQAIAGAISRGTTVVVAAGNSNADVSQFSPASCPGVIAVASNGITGKRAYYSNYGSGVTISAPGGGVYPNDGSSGTPTNDGFVWSAINAGTTTPGNATYGGMAGTSQATPHVAGTVALILSATREAGLATPSPDTIRSLLTTTARPFPAAPDQPVGAGIVNAYAAVNSALGNDNGGGDEPVIALTRGSVLGSQTGGTGASLLYSIDVPAGARSLNIRSFGGTGDATLYVKAGAAPGRLGEGADFTSDKPGNSEAVVVSNPQATTYYVRVLAKNAFSNVSVMATYTAP
ncbi:S8 family peptidase [Dyella sp. GSA-30]|uniref:S8 family peptidase n=1 Tax=Dyella sp. GSA-30 TaxID=2994496 RepID=UPI0024909393|nr:S8 family peptidase [Dyella sp. GSA-30]BDU20036.1 protease [Dyella sp. GSA-30]